MTCASDELIEAARSLSIAEAAIALNLAFKVRGAEHPQPCPVSGGKDRFSFNTVKNQWHCRHCGTGGHDGIGMAAHNLGFDLKTRAGLLEACAKITGRPIPDDAERESDEDRTARLARLEAQRLQNLEEMARRQAEGDEFREKERGVARGIYDAAAPIRLRDAAAGYLQLRGANLPHPEERAQRASKDARWLRFSPKISYWHGQDELRRKVSPIPARR
jgi:rubredoxin